VRKEISEPIRALAVNSLHFMKTLFITKARNDENTKEKKTFVLFNFRVFVTNPFGFSACGGSGFGIEIKL